MSQPVPVDYQSRVQKPEDFEAFWDDVLHQVAAIPLNPEIIPDPLRTSEEVEVFQVFYTSLEHVRIAAWYCRPARLGVTGSSQGGGLTITTAAMRPEIRAAAAGAPYLCGFLDAIELTHTYPYEEINDFLRLHPESRHAVEETVAYFDGINFADKITCPIIVNIGLQDNVCPPETGYALFDRIGAEDKRLYPYDGHGHDAGRARQGAIVDRFFARHLLGRQVSQ